MFETASGAGASRRGEATRSAGPGATSSPSSPGCPTSCSARQGAEGSLHMPASLARRYDEHVQVDHRDNEPIAFVRRRRGYVVRTVLAHWWETGPWWEAAESTDSALTGPEPTGVHDDERELWRVEAVAPGRSSVVV